MCSAQPQPQHHDDAIYGRQPTSTASLPLNGKRAQDDVHLVSVAVWSGINVPENFPTTGREIGPGFIFPTAMPVMSVPEDKRDAREHDNSRAGVGARSEFVAVHGTGGSTIRRTGC